MFAKLLLSAPQSPPDFWHDPFGQFLINVVIAIIVGVCTAIVAIIIYRKQRKDAIASQIVKKITFTVVSEASIANINRAVKDRVQILFDGKPVSDMYLLILQVKNSGNAAVKPDDYVEPIEFTLKGRKVIYSEILYTIPKDILNLEDAKNFLKIEQDTLILSKLLLNPNEILIIKILLEGKPTTFIGRARIVNGQLIEFDPTYSAIEYHFTEMQKSAKLLPYFSVMAIFLLILLISYILIFIKPIFPLLLYLLGSSVITIIIIIIGNIFVFKISKQKMTYKSYPKRMNSQDREEPKVDE